MSSQLKHCPLCGGDQLDIGITGGATFWVECSSCGSCSACRNGGRKKRIVLVEQIERVLNPQQILLPGLAPEVAGDW